LSCTAAQCTISLLKVVCAVATLLICCCTELYTNACPGFVGWLVTGWLVTGSAWPCFALLVKHHRTNGIGLLLTAGPMATLVRYSLRWLKGLCGYCLDADAMDHWQLSPIEGPLASFAFRRTLDRFRLLAAFPWLVCCCGSSEFDVAASCALLLCCGQCVCPCCCRPPPVYSLALRLDLFHVVGAWLVLPLQTALLAASLLIT